MSSKKICVVIGGRGFAARHLVEMLIKSRDWDVVKIADLSPVIKLEQYEEDGVLGEALRSGDAEYVSANLCDKVLVIKACQGSEAVFHMAAPDSSINNHQLHHSVNVEGTRNVIEACVKCQVKRLIYTSSPSVVFDGVHGIFNADESMPYPPKHNDSYSATKSQGESLVLESNGKSGLLTCCIRPSSIFGPGDKLLVPSLVTAARAGKAKFIIGSGDNMYDFTYVENVARAHICADKALASEGTISERAAGQAYFITNTEPIKFWEFMSQILEGLGYERPSVKIPAPVMMPIAHMVEWIYKIFGPYGMRVPQLTPSRIRLLSCNRTFNSYKAKDRLGYMPIVSLQDGINITIASYAHLQAEQQTRREGPSKAHIYLGSGKVAETLLWKDKKQTLTSLIVLISFYNYFIASGYTVITALSKILLLATIMLFVHGILPAKIFGFTIEKLPACSFYFSEERCRQVAIKAVSKWNCTANVLNSLCKGQDWSMFLKVVACLMVLSFLGATPVRSIFIIGIPLAFVAFVVYENKEEEIDALVHSAISLGRKLKFEAANKFSSSK